MFWKSKGKSLNAKITLSLISGAVVLVIASALTTYLYSYKRAYDRVETLLGQIILTVKENASVAAYVNNTILAKEVVNNLSKTDLIAGATILVSDSPPIRSDAPFSASSADSRAFLLYAPFSKDVVGSVEVYIDDEYILKISRQSLKDYLYWQLPMLLLLTFASTVIVHRLIIKPISSIARQMHSVSIEENTQIFCPSNHLDDELGQLTHDINHMIGIAREAFNKEAYSRREIEKLEKRFRLIFENSKAGIVLLDSNNTIMMSNPSFAELFKLEKDYANRKAFDLEGLFNNSAEFLQQLKAVRTKKQSIFFDLKVSESISADKWVRCVLSEGDYSSGGMIEAVFYDITDRTQLEMKYSYQATHDALTGLLNRLGAEQALEKALSETRLDKGLFALFLCDLNDFKPVNDQYGHETGDLVLIEVATRLKTLLRTQDIIVRWGGDEFVLGIKIDSVNSIGFVAEKIMSGFDEPIQLAADLSCKVGTSIGISLFPEHGESISDLIEKADQAMYEVKNRDKRGYLIHQ